MRRSTKPTPAHHQSQTAASYRKKILNAVPQYGLQDVPWASHQSNAICTFHVRDLHTNICWSSAMNIDQSVGNAKNRHDTAKAWKRNPVAFFFEARTYMLAIDPSNDPVAEHGGRPKNHHSRSGSASPGSNQKLDPQVHLVGRIQRLLLAERAQSSTQQRACLVFGRLRLLSKLTKASQGIMWILPGRFNASSYFGGF